MQEVVYIYEYVLVFFSKSWVCLGIQGHTPGAATEHRWGVEERLAEVAGGEEELPAAAGARAGLCERLLARARAQAWAAASSGACASVGKGVGGGKG